jgi:hypothetical protein
MKHIVKGLLVSFFFFVLGILILYITAFFSSHPITAGIFCRIWLVCTPFVGGIMAGLNGTGRTKHSMTKGVIVGILLFLPAQLFIAWFVPLFLTWEGAGISLAICIASGGVGGIFGEGLTRAKKNS